MSDDIEPGISARELDAQIKRELAHPLYDIYRELRDHPWIDGEDGAPCGCSANLHRIADNLAARIKRESVKP
jgi:hypothetical protein